MDVQNSRSCSAPLQGNRPQLKLAYSQSCLTGLPVRQHACSPEPCVYV